MAEAIVGPLLSKLQQVVVTEGKALAGVGKEIDRLRNRLMWLHALVHETNLRTRNDGNQLVCVLACQMREVAFEAEDALDSFSLEADLGHDWFRAAAKFFLNLGTQIRVRCILSGKIKSMNARLEDIIDNSAKYTTGSASAITWRAPPAIPPLRQNWMHSNLEHGEETQKSLVEHLGKSDNLVICVVGESGVGKRHLVKNACENETIKKKFKEHIWVNIPPGTSNITDKITRKLDEIARKPEDKYSMLPENLDQVYDYLVMVDCPTTQSSRIKISILQEWLKGRKGSKIVLTATSCPPIDAKNAVIIKLGYLDSEKSFKLFNDELGLGGRRKSMDKTEKMNCIRDHIEEITNGLPLAVILLARLMRTMNINKWEAASNYLRNNHQDHQLKTIVAMCIDDLPDDLKSCLLYTAGFPACSIMDRGQLVRLWMAEGFLTQQQWDGEGVEPKELGQRYIDEFIFRGLVLEVKKGESVGLALHDRVHAIFKSDAQCTSFMETHYGGSAPLPDSVRRLALSSKKLVDKNMVLTKLRTVLSHGHDQWLTQHSGEQGQSPRVSCSGAGYIPCPATSWFCGRPSPRQTSISMYATAEDGHHDEGSRPNLKEEFRQLLKHSTFLRVISLECIEVGEKLPNQIGNMLHLQYLGIRCCTLKKVPGSIGKLRKLQTMDVRGTQVKKLPKSFWEIEALRHVLGEHDLHFPEFARHLNLMMLNETVSGEAETEESVMPPKADSPSLEGPRERRYSCSETFRIHDNAAPTEGPLSNGRKEQPEADEVVQELGEDVESTQDSDVTAVMGQATKTTNSRPSVVTAQPTRRSERIAQQPPKKYPA